MDGSSCNIETTWWWWPIIQNWYYICRINPTVYLFSCKINSTNVILILPSVITHLLHVGWRNICKLPWFLQESSVSWYSLCYSCICTIFRRISDSWFMSRNLLGLCHIPLNTLSAGVHRQTDKLIQVGLGNLWFFQVKLYGLSSYNFELI